MVTTTHPLPGIREVVNSIEAVLVETPIGNQVFRSDVPKDPLLSSDSKVNGYAVIYPGAPIVSQTRLSPQPDAKNFPFQITCVGGDDNRCMRIVDIVSDVLPGLRVEYEHGEEQRRTGPLRQDITGPDAVLIDRGINPPRFYLPLLFRCRIF